VALAAGWGTWTLVSGLGQGGGATSVASAPEGSAQAAFDALTPRTRAVTATLAANSGLEAALVAAGASAEDAKAAFAAASGLGPEAGPSTSARDMTLLFAGEPERLAGLSLRATPQAYLYANRTTAGTWKARLVASAPIETVVRADGVIETSFAEDARKAGAPQELIEKYAEVFSFDLDFQRMVGPGDRFEMVFRRQADLAGRTLGVSEILFMSYRKGEDPPLEYYRFTGDDDKTDWYARDGGSARKTFMRTPLNGARLTSAFGFRKHPILGYSKLHAGVDFGAPVGTPIFATADGTVMAARYSESFGNVVYMCHEGDAEGPIHSRYAHMTGFAPGIAAGVEVKQGTTIGYLGSTGRSTGPHLHFELRRNCTADNAASPPMDPMTLTSNATTKLLQGAELVRFEAERDRIDGWRRGAPSAAR
jgi:murein DD-endopeptidase MepM/ murein hydrolase activator NlpD